MDGARKKKRPKIVCLCNGVSKDAIEQAICEGAQNLDALFIQTSAGIGSCGGSCRPKLEILLKSYACSGQFPDEIQVPKKSKNPRSKHFKSKK